MSRIIVIDLIGNLILTQANFSISPRDSRIGPYISVVIIVSSPESL